jgi:hypothetical protein
MAQDVPRKHHYIPQFLLANFTNEEGVLWTYDTEQKKSWQSTPRTTGFERDLYAVTTKDEERDFGLFEKALASAIDEPGADAISGLLKRQHLGPERFANFLGFVAAQMQRTPASFERLTATIGPSMQETFERVAKFHPEFRENVSAALAEEGATAAEIEEQFQAMATGQYIVHPHREFVLMEAFKAVAVIHTELCRMRWVFSEVPQGEADLILGDHPVMLADVGPDDVPPKPLGLKNPHIELVFPLSKRMLAIARWTGPNSYGELAPGSVEVINGRTLRYARRFSFASVQSEALLAEAIRLKGTGPKVSVKRIRLGESLFIKHEYR